MYIYIYMYIYICIHIYIIYVCIHDTLWCTRARSSGVQFGGSMMGSMGSISGPVLSLFRSHRWPLEQSILANGGSLRTSVMRALK